MRILCDFFNIFYREIYTYTAYCGIIFITIHFVKLENSKIKVKDMINYKIHFIRHGKTEGNLNMRYVGRTDLPVCEEGMKELKALTRDCIYPNIQKMYVSPLLRCKQTAETIYPDTYAEIVDDLMECDFGSFEGKSYNELKDDPDFVAWLKGEKSTADVGGEYMPDFANRCKRAFEYIFHDMMDKGLTSCAVVTHGGVIMSLFAMLGYPKKKMGEWMVQNGRGYTVLATPAMWMRDEGFEVFDICPYEK